MQNALIENFLHIDDMLVEPNGKAELKKFAKISKEKEELQNKKEKNKAARRVPKTRQGRQNIQKLNEPLKKGQKLGDFLNKQKNN